MDNEVLKTVYQTLLEKRDNIIRVYSCMSRQHAECTFSVKWQEWVSEEVRKIERALDAIEQEVSPESFEFLKHK